MLAHAILYMLLHGSYSWDVTLSSNTYSVGLAILSCNLGWRAICIPTFIVGGHMKSQMRWVEQVIICIPSATLWVHLSSATFGGGGLIWIFIVVWRMKTELWSIEGVFIYSPSSGVGVPICSPIFGRGSY